MIEIERRLLENIKLSATTPFPRLPTTWQAHLIVPYFLKLKDPPYILINFVLKKKRKTISWLIKKISTSITF